jgi:hypothetical protein
MKLGVCVPYRNREAHLEEFIPRVGKFLEERGIEYAMYFGHQVDDKLFNRGAMKNIAAEQAFKDGCDYVVWHDIDMIPEDDHCDYSFPKDNPRHIAIHISKTNYHLKYADYFGGAVIFSKEQVEKTNGYSNEYWDWGMEDDDLFWRCVLEGYANIDYVDYEKTKPFLRFNGENSYVKIPCSPILNDLTHKSHTVSVLVRAFHQDNKMPIYLIGAEDKKFVEYPIFRRPGYDYGISYNNSRAYTIMLWDIFNKPLYQWMKRYENQWTWVTFTVDANNKKIHTYLNGIESQAASGTGTNSPASYLGGLKRYDNVDYYLGMSPSANESDPAKYFKGDMGKLIIWNRCLTQKEVVSSFNNKVEGAVLDYDFLNDKLLKDNTGNNNNGLVVNCEKLEETIKVPHTIIPHRTPGRMDCLDHVDEGFVDGKWAKGETTAKNEYRYIMGMQQGKIDYKKDGMNTLKYTLVSKEEIAKNCFMLNVIL